MRYLVLRFAPLVLLLSSAVAQASEPPPAQIVPQPGEEQQQAADFDGVWRGRIHFDKEALLTATSTPEVGLSYRIEISGSVVRVSLDQDGLFSEVMPGAFHIAPVMKNAVIFGSQYSAGWTETWVFVVTQKEPNTLIVNFTRVVNNNGVPLGDPDSKFSTRGVGDFQRVSP
jgi:hypothetical protein